MEKQNRYSPVTNHLACGIFGAITGLFIAGTLSLVYLIYEKDKKEQIDKKNHEILVLQVENEQYETNTEFQKIRSTYLEEERAELRKKLVNLTKKNSELEKQLEEKETKLFDGIPGVYELKDDYLLADPDKKEFFYQMFGKENKQFRAYFKIDELPVEEWFRKHYERL